MPDSLDHAWLGWLTEHPEEWSADDLSKAEQMLVDQKRAIAESDPRDVLTRRSLQSVVDGLEAAVEAYRAQRS